MADNRPFFYTSEKADVDSQLHMLDEGFIPAPFLDGECFVGGINPMQFSRIVDEESSEDGKSGEIHIEIPTYDKEEIERVRNSDVHSSYFGRPYGVDMSQGGEIIKVDFEDIRNLFEEKNGNQKEYEDKFDHDKLYIVKYTNSPVNISIQDSPDKPDFKVFNICTLYAYPKQTEAQKAANATGLPAMLTMVTDSSGLIHHVFDNINTSDLSKFNEFKSLRINPSIIVNNKIRIDKIADQGITANDAPSIENFAKIGQPFVEMMQDMLPSIVARYEFMESRAQQYHDDHILYKNASNAMDMQTYSARSSLIKATENTVGSFADFVNIVHKVSDLRSAIDKASFNGDGRTLDDIRELGAQSLSHYDKFSDITSISRLLDSISEKDENGQYTTVDKLIRDIQAITDPSVVYEKVSKISSFLNDGGMGSLPSNGSSPIDADIKKGLIQEIENAVSVKNNFGYIHFSEHKASRVGTTGDGSWIKDGSQHSYTHNSQNDRYVVDQNTGFVYDRDSKNMVVPPEILNTYTSLADIGESFNRLSSDEKCRVLYDTCYKPSELQTKKVSFDEYKSAMMSSQLTAYEEAAVKLDKDPDIDLHKLVDRSKGFLLYKNEGQEFVYARRAFNLPVVPKKELDAMSVGGNFSALQPEEKCSVLFNILESTEKNGKIVLSDKSNKSAYTRAFYARRNYRESQEQGTIGEDINYRVENELKAEFSANLKETTLASYERAYSSIFEQVDSWYTKEDVCISKDGSFEIELHIKDKDINISVDEGKVSAEIKTEGTDAVTITDWKDIRDAIGDRKNISEATVFVGTAKESVSDGTGTLDVLRNFIFEDKEDTFFICHGEMHTKQKEGSVAYTQINKSYENFVTDTIKSTLGEDTEDNQQKKFAIEVLTGNSPDVSLDKENLKKVFNLTVDTDKKDTVTQDEPNAPDTKTQSETIDIDESGLPFVMTYGKLNSHVSITADGSSIRVPTGNEDKNPPVDVKISKWKMDEIQQDVDRYAERYQLTDDDKKAELQARVDNVKNELRGYVRDAKMWETSMQRIDIPRTMTTRHFGFQYAKMQHTYAIYSYEKAGGAIGINEAVTKGVGVLALHCARNDFYNTDTGTTMIINFFARSDAKVKAEIYIRNHKAEIETAARTEAMQAFRTDKDNDDKYILKDTGKTYTKEEYQKEVDNRTQDIIEGKERNIRNSIVNLSRFENPFAVPDTYVDTNGNIHKISAYNQANIVHTAISIGLTAAAIAVVPQFAILLGIGVLSNFVTVAYEFGSKAVTDHKIEVTHNPRIATGNWEDPVNRPAMDIINRIITQSSDIAKSIRDFATDFLPHITKEDEDNKKEWDAWNEEKTDKNDTEDETVAKESDAEDEPVAKESDAEDEPVAKESDTEDESVTKDSDAEDESVTKESDTEDESVIKDSDAEDESATKESDTEDEPVVKDSDAEDESVTKDSDADDKPVAKDSDVEDESVTKDSDANDKLVTKESDAEDKPVTKESDTEETTTESSDTKESKYTNIPLSQTDNADNASTEKTTEAANENKNIPSESSESSHTPVVSSEIVDEDEADKENVVSDTINKEDEPIIVPDLVQQAPVVEQPTETLEIDPYAKQEAEKKEEEERGRKTETTQKEKEPAVLTPDEIIRQPEDQFTDNQAAVPVITQEYDQVIYTALTEDDEEVQPEEHSLTDYIVQNIEEKTASCFHEEGMTIIENYKDFLIEQADYLLPDTPHLNSIMDKVNSVFKTELSREDTDDLSDRKTIMADIVVVLAEVFYGESSIDITYGCEQILTSFDPFIQTEIKDTVYDHAATQMNYDYDIISKMGDVDIYHARDSEETTTTYIEPYGVEYEDVTDASVVMDGMYQEIDALDIAAQIATDASDYIRTDVEIAGDYMQPMEYDSLWETIMCDSLQNETATAEDYQTQLLNNPDMLMQAMNGELESVIDTGLSADEQNQLIINEQTQQQAVEQALLNEQMINEQNDTPFTNDSHNPMDEETVDIYMDSVDDDEEDDDDETDNENE